MRRNRHRKCRFWRAKRDGALPWDRSAGVRPGHRRRRQTESGPDRPAGSPRRTRWPSRPEDRFSAETAPPRCGVRGGTGHGAGHWIPATAAEEEWLPDVQTAQRLDGFDAKEAGGKSGQVAGGNRQKKRGRSGVLAHADFVEGQRNHEQIEGVEKPCQEDSAMRRTTGGDLADDRILIYAIPLAQTHGQDLLLRNWIETTEQVDDDHCGSRWARAERVAQGMRGLRAEFLRELHGRSRSRRRTRRLIFPARCSAAARGMRRRTAIRSPEFSGRWSTSSRKSGTRFSRPTRAQAGGQLRPRLFE